MSWSQYIGRIIDVCEVIAGQSPKSTFYNKDGEGLPFYQGKKEFNQRYIGEPTTWTTKVTKEAFENDILMSVRAPVGPINLSTQHICIGRGLAAIRASEKINRDYLFYYLLKHESEIVGNTGAVFNSINKSQIGNIPIPIPPLQEQQKIIEILDQAFVAIDQAKTNIEKNIENAKELFQSKLNDIFSQKGEGWEEKKLIEVNKFIDYRGKTPKKTESGIKLITAKNVRMGYMRNEPEEFIAEEDYDDWMTRGIPEEGDVLFTTEAPLANVTLLNTNEKIALAQRIITLCPDKVILSGEYLAFCLQSKVIQDKILEKGTGATVTGIKSRLLKEIVIPIPPIKTQEGIVEIMNKMRVCSDEIIFKLNHKLNSLEELKKSILQKAFAGELTNQAVEI